LPLCCTTALRRVSSCKGEYSRGHMDCTSSDVHLPFERRRCCFDPLPDPRDTGGSVSCLVVLVINSVLIPFPKFPIALTSVLHPSAGAVEWLAEPSFWTGDISPKALGWTALEPGELEGEESRTRLYTDN
jgi:hypothetical protein